MVAGAAAEISQTSPRPAGCVKYVCSADAGLPASTIDARVPATPTTRANDSFAPFAWWTTTTSSGSSHNAAPRSGATLTSPVTSGTSAGTYGSLALTAAGSTGARTGCATSTALGLPACAASIR